MLSDYLQILKAKTLLFSPPNPPSDKVSSYKGTPPSTLIDHKGRIKAGITLFIRHWSKNPEDYQKPGYSKSVCLVPQRRRVPAERGDPKRSGSGRTPRKEVDHKI